MLTKRTEESILGLRVLQVRWTERMQTEILPATPLGKGSGGVAAAIEQDEKQNKKRKRNVQRIEGIPGRSIQTLPRLWRPRKCSLGTGPPVTGSRTKKTQDGETLSPLIRVRTAPPK